MTRRTCHEIWRYIRHCGGGVDGIKVGRRLGLMKEVSADWTKEGAIGAEKERKGRDRRTV